MNPANSVMGLLEDTDQYRYDTSGIYGRDLMRNGAMLKGFMGTSFYFSTTNQNIGQYQEEMYLADPMAQSFDNLEDRSYLAALASVKYEIIHKGDEARLMRGFSEKAAENERFSAYEDIDALPMVYTYDGWIGRNDYEAMPVWERQEALLQGAVVDGTVSLPNTVPAFDSKEIQFQIIEENGLECREGEIIVKEDNASMILEFDGLADSETYVVAEGIRYYTLDSGKSAVYSQEIGRMGKLKKFLHYTSGVISVTLSAATDTNGTSVEIMTSENAYYGGREDFLCNLGYQKEGVKQIRLNFSLPGIYQIEKLSVACQPVRKLPDLKKKLGQDKLALEKSGINEYRCQADLDEKKIVCFSVPYGSGWKASIDGKDVPLLRVNTMYMGVEVSEGYHEIIVRYRTPGLLAGLGVSAVSLAALFIFMRKKRWEV